MIRLDFVSNSSSSSFIVIASTNLVFNDYSDLGEIAIPTLDYGYSEFGWAFEKYDDFWSKLNFCALILLGIEWYATQKMDNKYCDAWKKCRIIDAKKVYEKYKQRLETVCKNKFNLDINILSFSQIKDNYNFYAYIDHQSSWAEAPENAKMFEDEESLTNFLASKDSYIKTGNDNNDPPVGWYKV